NTRNGVVLSLNLITQQSHFLDKHSGRAKNNIRQKMAFNCGFYSALLSVAPFSSSTRLFNDC
ncbi:hypothetical protein AB6C93_18765, partial [Vibrio splendidus]